MENDLPPTLPGQRSLAGPVSALPYFHERGDADALIRIAACGVLISGGMSVVSATAQSFAILSTAASYGPFPGLMTRLLSVEAASLVVGFIAVFGGIACLQGRSGARRLLVAVESSRLVLTLVALLIAILAYLGRRVPPGYPQWYVFFHPLSVAAQSELLHGFCSPCWSPPASGSDPTKLILL